MHGRVAFPVAIAFGSVLLLVSRVGGSEVEKMEAVGPLILRCPFAGDRREDNCSPSGADAWPLSTNRWMVIYHSRGYGIVDQERSVFYQLREGAPDGRILCERSLDPSDQYGDKAFYKSHGHVMVWGVPKGALNPSDQRPAGRGRLGLSMDYDPASRMTLAIIKANPKGGGPVALWAYDADRDVWSRVTMEGQAPAGIADWGLLSYEPEHRCHLFVNLLNVGGGGEGGRTDGVFAFRLAAGRASGTGVPPVIGAITGGTPVPPHAADGRRPRRGQLESRHGFWMLTRFLPLVTMTF